MKKLKYLNYKKKLKNTNGDKTQQFELEQNIKKKLFFLVNTIQHLDYQ